MRKTLIALGVLVAAYYLYKQYTKEDKPKADPPQKTGDAVALAIKEAQAPKPPQPKSIYQQNWDSFREMKGVFNAEESATVAPSINAKIGIF